jgi:hypothetical protein
MSLPFDQRDAPAGGVFAAIARRPFRRTGEALPRARLPGFQLDRRINMRRTPRLAGPCALVVPALVTLNFALSATAASLPFTYRKGGIPDLDQRRQSAGGHYGLPGDGSQYCAPTSAMDLLAYIANHGYGGMAPFGFRNWSSQDLYDTAGVQIFDLGFTFMGTDPGTGTSDNGTLQGIKDWLDAWGVLSDFSVDAQFASGTSCPTPDDLANAALQGGLVMPIVGWYSFSISGYTRVGGHLLAMNKLVGTQTPGGPSYSISWRDPASDEGTYTTQSPFSTETYTLSPYTATFDGNSRTEYRVNNFNYSGNSGFIDGYIVITPKYALTAAPGDYEFDLYSFSLVTGASARPAHVAATGGILHAGLHPSMSKAVYLTIPDLQQYSELRVLDPLSGQSVLIQSAVEGAQKVAVSRHRRAYVLDQYGIGLHGYDLDQVQAPYVATMPQYLNTVAYDDLYDLVYVLGTVNTRLVWCPADLSSVNDVQLPPGLNLNLDAPMFVSPVTSNVWIASAWASALYELGIDEFGVATLLHTVSDPALALAVGLSVDDRDHAFVSTSTGAGLEFGPDGLGGFQRITPSVLDGLTLGSVLQVSYSRSNFDPATMIGPAYYEALPTEFATPEYDLPGDLNCDGLVNAFDIDPFVLALTDPLGHTDTFPACDAMLADINADGAVNAFDIDPFVQLLVGG